MTDAAYAIGMALYHLALLIDALLGTSIGSCDQWPTICGG